MKNNRILNVWKAISAKKVRVLKEMDLLVNHLSDESVEKDSGISVTTTLKIQKAMDTYKQEVEAALQELNLNRKSVELGFDDIGV